MIGGFRVAGRASNLGRNVKLSVNVKLIVKDILVNSVAGSDVAVFPLRVAIYRAYGIDTRTMNICARCLFTGSHVLLCMTYSLRRVPWPLHSNTPPESPSPLAASQSSRVSTLSCQKTRSWRS